MEHYVYLYRDLKNRPRYVGYGKGVARATDRNHNESFVTLLDSRRYTLEIAGPFNNEATARAIETALISALRPDCNIDPGQARWRFRPFGVPEIFAERLSLEELQKTDFVKLLRKTKQPIILVKISDKDFENEEEGIRIGYNPAHPPTDKQILHRMDHSWRLGRFVERWSQSPKESAALLVGIYGSPGAQFIIGAAFIDTTSWHKAKYDAGFYSIPTLKTPNLDAYELRGRRISRDANIRFGALYHQIFLIMNPDGTIEGGSPEARGK